MNRTRASFVVFDNGSHAPRGEGLGINGDQHFPDLVDAGGRGRRHGGAAEAQAARGEFDGRHGPGPLGGFASKIGTAATWIGAYAVISRVTGALTHGAESALAYEHQFARLQTVFRGTSEDAGAGQQRAPAGAL